MTGLVGVLYSSATLQNSIHFPERAMSLAFDILNDLEEGVDIQLGMTIDSIKEVWDATAADPKLLVFLKSYRNFLHTESGIKAVSHFRSGSWEFKI